MKQKDRLQLQTVLKHEDSIKNFIGRKTVLKFDFMSDNIAKYKTVTPIKINPNKEDDINSYFVNYEIEFFVEDGRELFCYDTLSEFLDRHQIYEVFEVPMEITNLEQREIIYCQTSIEQYKYK